MSLSFDQSGSGADAVGPLTLTEVQQLACDCGFAKPGVASSKPLALRADMPSFFKALGVTSLSAFRELFYNSRVAQPKPGQAPPPPAPKKQAAAAAPAVRALGTRREAHHCSLSGATAGVRREDLLGPGCQGVCQLVAVVRRPEVANHPTAWGRHHGTLLLSCTRRGAGAHASHVTNAEAG